MSDGKGNQYHYYDYNKVLCGFSLFFFGGKKREIFFGGGNKKKADDDNCGASDHLGAERLSGDRQPSSVRAKRGQTARLDARERGQSAQFGTREPEQMARPGARKRG